MDSIIEVKNLKKSFGEIKAVDDISFSVERGTLFAFLGLNGAGKSTTINVICGDLEKDFGEVFVSGKNIDNDLKSIKVSLGVVYQESVLDKQLSVKDNLECRAILYGLSKELYFERLEEIDKLLKIKELLTRTVGKLSGGQRRRVDIARALINNPQILILDEPTTGLDPKTRKMVWSAVEKLRKENGITVFLTTHYMEEVTDADNVVIIDAGKIVAMGSPLELKTKFTGDYIRLYNITEKEVKELGVNYQKQPECFVVEIKNSKEAIDLISKHPEVFVDYEIVKGKMDDVFLAVTGKILEQGENDA